MKYNPAAEISDAFCIASALDFTMMNAVNNGNVASLNKPFQKEISLYITRQELSLFTDQ